MRRHLHSIAALLSILLSGCASLDELVRKNVDSAMSTASICRNLEYSRKEIVEDWKRVLTYYREVKDKSDSERQAVTPQCDGNPIFQFADSSNKLLASVRTKIDICIKQERADAANARRAWEDLQATLDRIVTSVSEQARQLEDRCRADNRYCASYLMSVLFGARAGAGLVGEGIQALSQWESANKDALDKWSTEDSSCKEARDAAGSALAQARNLFDKFKDDNTLAARDVIEIVFFHEVSDAILTHLNRSLKGTEEQIYKLDEKLYGALTASNLVFGGEIQESANKLFQDLINTDGSGRTDNRKSTEISQMVLVNLAASSCRRLLRDVDVGESQYLMPYLLRAIVSASKAQSEIYKRKLESIAPVFACTVGKDADKAVELKRIDTALQLQRNNSLRQLGSVCTRLREMVPASGAEFVYCTVGVDDRSASIVVAPRHNFDFVRRVLARLGDLIVAHGLRLDYEVMPFGVDGAKPADNQQALVAAPPPPPGTDAGSPVFNAPLAPAGNARGFATRKEVADAIRSVSNGQLVPRQQKADQAKQATEKKSEDVRPADYESDSLRIQLYLREESFQTVNK